MLCYQDKLLWFLVFLLECCSELLENVETPPVQCLGTGLVVWFVEGIEDVFEIVNDHSLNDTKTNVNVRENYLTSLLGYLLWHYWHIREYLQGCCASQCTLMNSLVLPLMNHILAAQLLYSSSCYLRIILSLSPLSRELRRITWCILMYSSRIHRICCMSKKKQLCIGIYISDNESRGISSECLCMYIDTFNPVYLNYFLIISVTGRYFNRASILKSRRIQIQGFLTVLLLMVRVLEYGILVYQ